MSRVACIGECMIELRERSDGLLARFWGGDTLNTALYLARLGVDVAYVTALGDDEWSDQMLAAWREEGIDTTLVQRLPDRLPGLYVIQTDARGERRFQYWREAAAARRLFDQLDPAALTGFDTLYLSGVTLSIYDDRAREILFATLAAAHARGTRIAFDTNFRPRGWPDKTVARRLYQRIFVQADMILASIEDLVLLYGDAHEDELLRHAADTEIVLKLAHPASRIYHLSHIIDLVADPVDDIVDTTAAGDSFSAAYLAARLRGATPDEAGRAGHALAGMVIRHPGAIAPRSAMPDMRTP